MESRSWSNETGFHDLIHGRSFWEKVSVTKKGNNSAEVRLINKNDKDGPRAAGVALAALFHFYDKNIDNLPKNVFVKSDFGFKDSACKIFHCFSEIELRHKFIKSFNNGKNAISIDNSDNGDWKEYEKRVSADFKMKYPTYEDFKCKGVRADGLLKNPQGNILIYETKKKRLDLAEGLSQLVQYFIQISLEFEDAKISSFLVSPSGQIETTANYQMGLKFFRSDVITKFIVVSN
jgi:hypothetical protein